MPFKSQAQHRKFRAMLASGEITQAQFDEMMGETRKMKGHKKHPIKKLPEKVMAKKASDPQAFLNRLRHPSTTATKNPMLNKLKNQPVSVGKVNNKGMSIVKNAFAEGFYKGAEAAKKQKRKAKDEALIDVGAGISGLFVSGLFTRLNAAAFGEAVRAQVEVGKMSPGDAERIVAEYNKANPKHTVDYKKITEPLGAHYTDFDTEVARREGKLKMRAKPLVAASDEAAEAILRHELGHAANWKHIPEKLKPTAAVIRGLGFAGSPLVSAAMLFSGDEETRADAWKATAIGGAPTLIDEGLASLRAAKDMIKSDGFKKGLKKALPLLPAYGTYLSPLVGAAVASHILGQKDEE